MNLRQIAGLCSVGWLGILLFACAPEGIEEEPTEAIDQYFDVQGLLAQKEDQLREMEVVLKKKATFGGVVETAVVELDSLALAEELEVFREVDINKPVLADRYLIEKEEVDGKEVVTYLADEPEEMNINYLKVYMDAEMGVVERIEAFFSSRNVLYNSTRLLSMQFGQVNGRNLPIFYQVEGSQKMIFNEKENFIIKADFEYVEQN